MSESKKARVSFYFFILLSLIAILLALKPILSVLTDSSIDLYYSHIPLIPLITALLLRKYKVFFIPNYSSSLSGAFIAAGGILLYLLARFLILESGYYIPLTVLSAIIFWTGTFIAFFGFASFKKAFFAIAFLLLTVPIPERIMDKIVVEIAGASVHITDILFNLLAIPYTRQGIEIYLPGYIIVVGPECAGWRSSIALVIISLLAGHLFLNKFAHKLLLVALAIPMVIIKNGIRIVVLYLIAYFIDERFIEPGLVHRLVGYVIFIIALIFMGLLLWYLENKEKKKDTAIKTA